MKRLMKGALLALLLAAGCTRERIIPDDELARIFRDAFLTNAYVAEERPAVDSARLYEPIFARYGYTTRDVEHTIENFSRRKSARLSDVVEQAIALLDAEGARYDRSVAVLDTIAAVARRTYRHTLRSDSLIRVRRLADSSRLRIVLDSLQPGSCRITLRYLVDSLDRNPGLRGAVRTLRRDGTSRNSSVIVLRRGTEASFERNVELDSTMRGLEIDFADFARRDRGRLSVTLRNLRVEYTPELDAAVDSLYDETLGVRIFADEFFRDALPQDSL